MKKYQTTIHSNSLLARLLTTASVLALAACNLSFKHKNTLEDRHEIQPTVAELSTTKPIIDLPQFFPPQAKLPSNYVELPPVTALTIGRLIIDHKARSKIPAPVYDTKSSVNLVQVGSSNSNPTATITSTGYISFTKRYHDESATDILETTAETIANTNIQAILLDAYYLYDTPSRTMQYVTTGSDIMSFSYAPSAYRLISSESKNTFKAKNRIQNPDVKASVKEMFRQSSAVTLSSAGNEGYINERSIRWSDEFIVNLNETHLSVGAATLSPDGHVLATKYTAATAPTVLAVNPYEFGFQYNYIADRSDIESFIDKNLDSITELPKPSFCEAEDTSVPWLSVIMKYQGELYDQIITAKERQMIREALRECYLSVYDHEVKSIIHGTSFTTPHLAGLAGGILAKMRNKYGENALTSDELVASIILSAQTVWETEKKKKDGKPFSLEYDTTPAGLLYNDNIAGFGYVDYKELEITAERIAQFSAVNPSLKPKQMNTTVTSSSYADDLTTDGMKRYKLPVQDDFLVTRIMLELEFAGDPLNRTDVIYLQAPTGEKFRVGLTREKNTDKVIFGFTNGMYGSSTKGEWSILIPGDTESITSSSVTFHGVNKGSSIDIAVQQKAALQKAENQDSRVPPQRFNPMRFKIS